MPNERRMNQEVRQIIDAAVAQLPTAAEKRALLSGVRLVLAVLKAPRIVTEGPRMPQDASQAVGRGKALCKPGCACYDCVEAQDQEIEDAIEFDQITGGVF